jgi:hypothetical protein
MIELFLKYALVPLLTAIATVIWSLYKKHETRIDMLEKRLTDIEKAVIEIKSEFRYIAKETKEIKHLIQKLYDR